MLTVIFDGQVNVGGCVSFTVTVNEQPGPVVVVTFTVVVPKGKKDPDAGERTPQVPDREHRVSRRRLDETRFTALFRTRVQAPAHRKRETTAVYLAL